MELVKIKKILILLFIVKLIFLSLSFTLPFSHPHIVRQADTMAISIRYGLRWFHEDQIKYPLYPAGLLSVKNGDEQNYQYGIVSMEFPLLNLITGPSFYFSVNTGRILALYLNLFLCLLLLYWHHRVWKKLNILNIDMDLVSLSLVLVVLTRTYFSRFMPDFYAFILVNIALGYSWHKNRYFVSGFLCALGLLVKPPAVVVLGLLLLKKPSFWLKSLVWILPAVIVTIFYYTVGLDHLKSLADAGSVFMVHARHPLESLMSFLSAPQRIFELVSESFFIPILSWLMMGMILFRFLSQKKWQMNWLWIILVLQTIGIALLDGSHSFNHHYYYVGTSFVAALIFVQFLSALKNKWIISVLLLIIAGHTIEKSVYGVRELFASETHLYKQCEELQRLTPHWPWKSGFRFHTPERHTPELEVCFGALSGPQKSRYGFRYLQAEEAQSANEMPVDCRETHRTQQIALYECSI